MKLTKEEIIEFLSQPKRLAIVGASTKPQKAGNFVPKFLMERGFEIVPINPMTDEIFGIKTLKDIKQLDEKVDGAIIYRHTQAAEKEAKKAIGKGIPLIWFPLGVTSDETMRLTEETNTKFVQDMCPKEEIEKYIEEGIYQK